MIGTSVQRYEILEELGQGGMSVVYRARDTTLDRIVAVKLLHEHLAKKEENRDRFRREAKAIARLQHDHVVDVYDYSGEKDDDSFIVMEYVPGGNLRDFVDSHGHPPSEVASMIGLILADALDHAHEHGVIHRDLKPENVMVSEEGELKLMDFGIAHVVDAETMTQTGSLLGSPAHMAPEIIDGQDVNRRSDIFSVGTVLYWLATGEFPFKGENAPNLLRQVLECEYRDPEQIEPRISRDLAGIICRCLSRQPEDRFVSVAALRDALADSIEPLGAEVDVDAELTAYFETPDEYTREFEADIVDRLVEAGRTAMDRDDVPEAIAKFNRVLAFDPDNAIVDNELEDLNRRERTGRHHGVIAAVLVATVATAVYVAVRSPADGRGVDEAQSSVVEAVRTARSEHSRQAAVELAQLRADASRTIGRAVVTRTDAVRAADALIATTETVTVALHRTEPSSEVAPIAAARSNKRVELARAVAADEAETPETPDDETSDESGDSPEGNVDVSEQKVRKTFEWKFKVVPLAATVFIDGEQYSVPEVLNGVSLTRGLHRIRVTSPGCRDYEREFRVDGSRDQKMSIVLEWKAAHIQVLSNRAAVVYLNGDRSRPHQIGAGGEDARIEIPFGNADSDRRNSRKRLTLEIRPRNDMQVVREQTVTLRPGKQTSVNVNFPTER